MDEIDASIENAKSQLSETTMLKQQLENQIELLKNKIHSARMNDAHYDQRARTIDEEIKSRETQLTELETLHVQIESKIKEQKKKKIRRVRN